MALSARTAAWLTVLVTALASPLPAAARSRTAGAKAKKPHAPQTLRSQAPPRRAAPAELVPGRREESGSDLNAIVRWEDGSGAVHYTPGYEVPQGSRPQARRVYTSVGVVPLDRTEEQKPPSPGRGSTAAAFPVITLPPGPVPPPATTAQRSPSDAPQGPATGPSPLVSSGTGR